LPTEDPDKDSRRKFNPPTVVRIMSHLVVWSVVLLPATIEVARGWRPLGDDATIALQSFRVLSLHPPLLGQYSTISRGAEHVLFDPGPMQYVLLAIPTRVDGLQGTLWGAALISGLVLSIAVEALWRVGYWFGCAAVAFCLANVAWLNPGVVERLLWNPNMGLPFVIASIALAWVVALGSFRWWPVLVFTASVASQTEVLFATISLVLVVVSPLIGIWHSGRPKRLRWVAVTGLVVGAACWIAPVIQQITGKVGNFAAILQARGSEPSVGLGFGLRTVALTVWPIPIWLHHYTLPGTVEELGRESEVVGLAVFVLLAAVIVWAYRQERRDLAALGGISLVSSLATVLTYAAIPLAHFANLAYLVVELWIVGLLAWITIAWAAVEVIRYRIGRSDVSAETRVTLNKAAFGLVSAGALTVGVLTLWGIPSQSGVGTNRAIQIDRAADRIEALVPRGPVDLSFGGVGVSGLTGSQYVNALNELFLNGTAIEYQLWIRGYNPSLPPFFTHYTGLNYEMHGIEPGIRVVMMSNGRIVGVTRPATADGPHG
jgi:hypothetical protein